MLLATGSLGKMSNIFKKIEIHSTNCATLPSQAQNLIILDSSYVFSQQELPVPAPQQHCWISKQKCTRCLATAVINCLFLQRTPEFLLPGCLLFPEQTEPPQHAQSLHVLQSSMAGCKTATENCRENLPAARPQIKYTAAQ